MPTTRSLIVNRAGLILALLAAIQAGAPRAETADLPEEYRLNGEMITAAFLQASKTLKATSASVFRGRQRLALATLCPPGDYLVTKASEIEGDSGLEVVLSDGKRLPARRAGLDRSHDLLLLHVPGIGPPELAWAETGTPAMGSWVASLDRKGGTVRVGVIAARDRKIERVGGVLGVTLSKDAKKPGGVVVAKVMPNSAAMSAGIQEGDIITAVNEKAVSSPEVLGKAISSHDPGDLVTLDILREKEKLVIEVTLGHRSVIFDVFNRNQQMSGRTSKRRHGFSRVYHHDLPLHPRAMGGPLVGLDGRVLGVNIARSDRVTTYALPAGLVRKIVDKMIAGDKAKPAGGA